jgi:hypothetical protein
VIRRLVGAVMIGVATLFQPKGERVHWSIPPTWPVDDTSEDETDEP